MASLPTPLLVAAFLSLVAVAYGCTPRMSSTVAPKPPDASLRITSPGSNETVAAGPVPVRVEYRGPTLVPGAESSKLTDYHLHYFLDEDAAPYVGKEAVIPSGNPKIIHSAAQEITLEDVPPGPHTLTVVLTGNNHISFDPALSERVTFTAR
jgi:hypothetical protein